MGNREGREQRQRQRISRKAQKDSTLSILQKPPGSFWNADAWTASIQLWFIWSRGVTLPANWQKRIPKGRDSRPPGRAWACKLLSGPWIEPQRDQVCALCLVCLVPVKTQQPWSVWCTRAPHLGQAELWTPCLGLKNFLAIFKFLEVSNLFLKCITK